jgi:hypothetical protein
MDIFSDVNLTAVLAAAVAAFIVGFLWHGPIFGKLWMDLMGVSEAEVKAAKAKGMGAMLPHMIGALLQQIVLAFVLAYLGYLTTSESISEMMVLAAWVWLGFIVTVQLNAVLWEKRKPALYFLNIVYHLVSLLVVAAVLGWLS